MKPRRFDSIRVLLGTLLLVSNFAWTWVLYRHKIEDGGFAEAARYSIGECGRVTDKAARIATALARELPVNSALAAVERVIGEPCDERDPDDPRPPYWSCVDFEVYVEHDRVSKIAPGEDWRVAYRTLNRWSR